MIRGDTPRHSIEKRSIGHAILRHDRCGYIYICLCITRILKPNTFGFVLFCFFFSCLAAGRQNSTSWRRCDGVRDVVAGQEEEKQQQQQLQQPQQQQGGDNEENGRGKE